MDIMIVSNTMDVTSVAKKFDLSCEIYYDGNDIFSDNLYIKYRNGILNEDYVKPFLEGNIFIKNRISKYKSRGFNVRLSSVCQDIYLNSERKYSQVTDKETWLVKRLIHSLSVILSVDSSNDITNRWSSNRKGVARYISYDVASLRI